MTFLYTLHRGEITGVATVYYPQDTQDEKFDNESFS